MLIMSIVTFKGYTVCFMHGRELKASLGATFPVAKYQSFGNIWQKMSTSDGFSLISDPRMILTHCQMGYSTHFEDLDC